MTSLNIYKEQIIDLYKHPHNFGKLKNPTNKSSEKNTFCGDEVNVELKIKDNIVEDVKFSGAGCAISIASASLITDKIKGMNIEEIKKITSKEITDLLNINLGPIRMKCALISLNTIKKAMEDTKC